MAMLEAAPRIRFTASVPSGPTVVWDGCSDRACCASLTRAGRSAFSSMGRPRSLRTTFAVLSMSSLALPTARAGSVVMARWIRRSCSMMASGVRSDSRDAGVSCACLGRRSSSSSCSRAGVSRSKMRSRRPCQLPEPVMPFRFQYVRKVVKSRNGSRIVTPERPAAVVRVRSTAVISE